MSSISWKIGHLFCSDHTVSNEAIERYISNNNVFISILNFTRAVVPKYEQDFRCVFKQTLNTVYDTFVLLTKIHSRKIHVQCSMENLDLNFCLRLRFKQSCSSLPEIHDGSGFSLCLSIESRKDLFPYVIVHWTSSSFYILSSFPRVDLLH